MDLLLLEVTIAPLLTRDVTVRATRSLDDLVSRLARYDPVLGGFFELKGHDVTHFSDPPSVRWHLVIHAEPRALAAGSEPSPEGRKIHPFTDMLDQWAYDTGLTAEYGTRDNDGTIIKVNYEVFPLKKGKRLIKGSTTGVPLGYGRVAASTRPAAPKKGAVVTPHRPRFRAPTKDKSKNAASQRRRLTR